MNAGANALVDTAVFLSRGLQADTQLCLAATVAWLDPAWMLDADLDVDEDETSTLAYALYVLRRLFPDLYVQATEMLRETGRFADVDRLICSEMYKKGLPLDETIWLAYGVPMPAYGARLHDPDFYNGHEDLAAVVQLFEVNTQEAEVVPLITYKVGQLIAASLTEQPHLHYQQLAYLMQWLFSCSGNSCVDLNDEDMAEMQPLPWEPDEVAFALAIVAEADEIMQQAWAGLEWLNFQPGIFLALRENIRHVRRVLKQRGEKPGEPRIRLHWPRLTDRADGAATAHA